MTHSINGRPSLAALLVAIVLATPSGAGAGGSGWWSRCGSEMDLSAAFDLRVAASDDEADDDDLQSLQLTVEPELELPLGSTAELTARLRLRFDAENDLDGGAGDGGDGDDLDADLREFFVLWRVGDAWLTIGKQQIVWGKADGLKVLDVVNPQDFREFILEDFEDSRLPLWSLDAEIPLGDVALHLVWVPDVQGHQLPADDAAFAFTSPRLVPRPPPGVDVVVQDAEEPSNILSDGDVGLRLAGHARGVDWTAVALYHDDDLPALYRRIERRSGTAPRVVVAPRFERRTLVGGTFATSLGDWTVRGELGWHSDRALVLDDPTDTDGVAFADETSYVLGLDYFGFSDTLVSGQLFQTFLDDAPASYPWETASTRASLLVRRTLRHDTFEIEGLWLHDLDVDDGHVRAELVHAWSDTLRWRVGVETFYGDRDGLFGQFDRRDRVIAGMEWTTSW